LLFKYIISCYRYQIREERFTDFEINFYPRQDIDNLILQTYSLKFQLTGN